MSCRLFHRHKVLLPFLATLSDDKPPRLRKPNDSKSHKGSGNATVTPTCRSLSYAATKDAPDLPRELSVHCCRTRSYITSTCQKRRP